MLILNMLLRITGFTQEKLAKFLGISRVSVNSWLCDDSSMTNSSKKNIADKFQFPVGYFDIDLEQDLNVYKIVFSTLNDSWKRINNNTSELSNVDKINSILNEVESDIKDVSVDSIGEVEIIEGLLCGYDPFTGEVFDDDHILNNPAVKNILRKVKKNYSYSKETITKDDLTEEQFGLFEELRLWRREKYIAEGFFHAYMVFTDKELINIILVNPKEKEDLLLVKGIGEKKYEKYADELYDIISEYRLAVDYD